MNKGNLKKMADYIETIPQDKFDMYHFREGESVKHECDSVGSVLGHCTILDRRPLPLDKSGEIDFYAWSKDFTGLPSNSYEWQYLFFYSWSACDNTPVGAAKRIRHFLEQGLPKDWQKQMEGDASLSCYAPPSYIR